MKSFIPHRKKTLHFTKLYFQKWTQIQVKIWFRSLLGSSLSNNSKTFSHILKHKLNLTDTSLHLIRFFLHQPHKLMYFIMSGINLSAMSSMGITPVSLCMDRLDQEKHTPWSGKIMGSCSKPFMSYSRGSTEWKMQSALSHAHILNFTTNKLWIYFNLKSKKNFRSDKMLRKESLSKVWPKKQRLIAIKLWKFCIQVWRTDTLAKLKWTDSHQDHTLFSLFLSPVKCRKMGKKFWKLPNFISST